MSKNTLKIQFSIKSEVFKSLHKTVVERGRLSNQFLQKNVCLKTSELKINDKTIKVQKWNQEVFQKKDQTQKNEIVSLSI